MKSNFVTQKTEKKSFFLKNNSPSPQIPPKKTTSTCEQRPDGTYGNIVGKGNHDDIVMSVGIAVLISATMPPPHPTPDGSPAGTKSVYNE